MVCPARVFSRMRSAECVDRSGTARLRWDLLSGLCPAFAQAQDASAGGMTFAISRPGPALCLVVVASRPCAARWRTGLRVPVGEHTFGDTRRQMDHYWPAPIRTALRPTSIF